MSKKKNKKKRETIVKPKINWSLYISIFAAVMSVVSAYFAYQSNQLYKRDLESKILEIDLKRTDLLLEMLSQLKKVHFRLFMYKGGSPKGLNGISFKNGYKSDNKFLPHDLEHRNAPVVFLLSDLDSIIPSVLELAENPILPVEIKEKTKFLQFNSAKGCTSEFKKGIYTLVEFTYEQNKDFSEVYIMNNNNCTLDEYIRKYEDLFNEINIWIEKTTNSKHKLNI